MADSRPPWAECRGPMRSDSARHGGLRCLSLALIALLSLQGGILHAAAAPDALQQGLEPDLVLRLRQQHCDPFLAGLLSGVYWGLGQFYAKEYGRGSLFVFGDLLYKGFVLGLAITLKNKYTGPNDESVRWGEMSGTDKSFVIGAAVLWLGATVFAACDASEAARRYNKRTDELLGLDLSLRGGDGESVFCLGWNTKF